LSYLSKGLASLAFQATAYGGFGLARCPLRRRLFYHEMHG
jgi:hypothetical protein